jgi:hypothetical protein
MAKSGFFFDVRELEKRLEKAVDELKDETFGAAKAGGEVLLEGAKRRAPEDTGAYVNDHKLDVRKTLVGPAASIYTDPRGKSSKYAEIVHEIPKRLGPRSEKKQEANPDIVVGHKNIERAIKEDGKKALEAAAKYLDKRIE